MTNYVLETQNLSKSFGNVTAVDRVNLQVHAGEVFGFLGPNGAGKTTTIGMMLGLILPSNGRITVFDEPVTLRHTTPLRQVGSLVGAPALLPYLSGRENLRLLARLYPDVDDNRIEEILNLVKMTAAAGRKLNTYSTGMKQRLGLSAALLHRPKLVVLDEPTNGLDPAGMREVRQLIRRLADEGITVFLSSHLLHEVEQVCDRIAVIHRGQIVKQGAVNEILNQSQLSVKLRVADPQAAAAVLERLPELTGLEIDGGYIQLSGVDAETAVAQLAQNGIFPGEVTTRQSALEDIFLKLTATEEG